MRQLAIEEEATRQAEAENLYWSRILAALERERDAARARVAALARQEAEARAKHNAKK